MTGSRLGQRLRKLARIGPRGWALWAEAVTELARARAALMMRPFDAVMAARGTLASANAPLPGTAPLEGAERAAAHAVGWAVRSVAHWMPFRSVCLQQALAADAMLRRRGLPCRLTFGVRHHATGALDAHAWVEAGGVRVTGYPVHEDMRAIAVMASDP